MIVAEHGSVALSIIIINAMNVFNPLKDIEEQSLEAVSVNIRQT